MHQFQHHTLVPQIRKSLLDGSDRVGGATPVVSAPQLYFARRRPSSHKAWGCQASSQNNITCKEGKAYWDERSSWA
ncbi:hypothetical protein CBOM_01821 [Ceraceosorus bombacis]|uniref:Uncharacterized protein n=1 Tax=Ceraceosorus bombacis TaxID=401625 RepID=A0A0P1BDI2_9BASI|nr:hypothetical protein CBOM_01821 [Ceraceosorus bombacis]